MIELDNQNRNLIYQLNIGDIIEMADYRNTTIKGRIIGLNNYSIIRAHFNFNSTIIKFRNIL